MSKDSIASLSETLELAEAQAITGRIRSWVRAYPTADVARAYQGRIWLTLGYESWQEYCDCELDGFKLPTRSERPAVVEEMASEPNSMSNRAIAKALGIDEGTVRNDKRGAENSAPDPSRKVQGQDGRSYPATKIKPEVAPGLSVDNLAELNTPARPPVSDFHCNGDDGYERGRKDLKQLLSNMQYYTEESPERRAQILAIIDKARLNIIEGKLP